MDPRWTHQTQPCFMGKWATAPSAIHRKQEFINTTNKGLLMMVAWRVYLGVNPTIINQGSINMWALILPWLFGFHCRDETMCVWGSWLNIQPAPRCRCSCPIQQAEPSMAERKHPYPVAICSSCVDSDDQLPIIIDPCHYPFSTTVHQCFHH